MALTVGCATKKYVSKQVDPVIKKVDELDERTAQTTRGIRELDQRSQQGIQAVDAKAASADQKAVAAGQQADQAQQLAARTSTGVNDLTNQVINLDNYHAVRQTGVHFAFNKSDLTARDKKELDEIAEQVPSVKSYIFQISGHTDSVGDAKYNYELSKRRAAAVIQYLVSRHNIPAHKVYIIGLGKDAPVEKNTTARGRAENRRVDVSLMTNTLESQNAEAPQQTPPAAANPQR